MATIEGKLPVEVWADFSVEEGKSVVFFGVGQGDEEFAFEGTLTFSELLKEWVDFNTVPGGVATPDQKSELIEGIEVLEAEIAAIKAAITEMPEC